MRRGAMYLQNYRKIFQVSMEKPCNTLNQLPELRPLQDMTEHVISGSQRFLSVVLSLAYTKLHQFN